MINIWKYCNKIKQFSVRTYADIYIYIFIYIYMYIYIYIIYILCIIYITNYKQIINYIYVEISDGNKQQIYYWLKFD